MQGISSVRIRKPRDHVAFAVPDGEEIAPFYNAVLASAGAKVLVAHLVMVLP